MRLGRTQPLQVPIKLIPAPFTDRELNHVLVSIPNGTPGQLIGTFRGCVHPCRRYCVGSRCEGHGFPGASPQLNKFHFFFNVRKYTFCSGVIRLLSSAFCIALL